MYTWFFESKSEILWAGLGSQAQDRSEHTGASPEKGLEGTEAYITYLIRSKGAQQGAQLEIQEIQPKHKTEKRVIQHWNRQSKMVVESPSLKIFKDNILSSLL